VIGISVAVLEVTPATQASPATHSERRETNQRHHPSGWFLAAIEQQ
jgi:hypothetical protein